MRPLRSWSYWVGVGARVVEGGMMSMRVPQTPVVWAMAQGGPGALAGLRVGDRLLSVNGRRPAWANDALVGSEGDTMRLGLGREGLSNPVEVTVVLRRAEGTYREFSVYDVCEARDGTMWFGLQNGEVARYQPGGTWRLYTNQDGMETGWGPHIAQTRDGGVWVVTDDGRRGVNRFDGRVWTHFRLGDMRGSNVNTSILETRDGTLWVGGFALYYLRDGKWQVSYLPAPTFPWHRLRLLEASDGALWVAGLGQMAVRLDYGTSRWTTYQGLWFEGETPDGAQWFLARDHGIVRRAPPARGQGAWVRYGVEDGLMDTPMAVLVTRKGDLWAAGSHGGLGATARFGAEGWVVQTHRPHKGDHLSGCVIEAADGSLWFGFGDANGLLRFNPSAGSGQGWMRYEPPEFPEGQHRIGQTGDGAIWVGGSFGLRRLDERGWTVVADPEGLTSYIHTVCGMGKGDLWVGTRTYGVFHFDGQGWRHYNERDGLANNQVNAVVRTADGSVWAATNGGVSRFDGRTWVTYALPHDLSLLVSEDGMRQSRDGALWLNVVNSRTVRYEPHTVPPETEITVSLDRVSQPGNTVLAWRGVDPWQVTPDEELQYSYRLDGGAWSPFSPEKNRVFLSLPGGRHTFEVKARDRDFNEDPTPAVIRFQVLPPVWREPWFVGMVALLVGAVGLQTGRVFRRDRRLRESNAALSAANRDLFQANEDLRREIVERRKVEEERARLVSLGQMVAGVAHEISQPLSAISATAEGLYLRLEEGIAVSRGRLMEMMKHVVELVERMVGTVEHLRVFSRDTSTETDVRFSVNEVIHSSLGLVGTQLRSHGVALTLDLTEGLPPVLGHPHQMEQVMLNLLNNARDALDEREEEANRQDAKSAKDPIETGGQRRREAESRRAGEPEKTSADSPIRRFAGSGGWEKRLWVRTRCEWNDLAWVVIEVEDNGAGIDEAHQARLFEPFFTTKPADRGTGIGLSICQAIVQRHGGWIACESRRGEGTTFRVGLPAVEG